MSTVTAIITTFNRSRLLTRAIESVLGQTFADWELLVLDNSSWDDTERVVRGFADRRIRYIKHQPLTIAAARNLGVREACGEFLGFLDDDDEWLPSKLAEQTAVFRRSADPKLAMVYGGFLRIQDSRIYEVFVPSLRGDILEAYLCDRDPLTGSASNPLLRRAAVTALGGYDERLACSEDWEFYLRLARRYTVDFVPQPVVKIRHHRGARLGDKLRDALAAELLMVENFSDVLNRRPRAKSFWFQVIGGKYCRLGELSVGRRYLRGAIKAYPANAVAYLQLLCSFLGTGFYARTHQIYQRW